MAHEHLIAWLDAFNRKERYYLIAHALGDFRLGDEFRSSLEAAIGVEVPPDAPTFMDYHLDWLHAAICLADTSLDAADSLSFTSPDFAALPEALTEVPPVYVNANQEDMDLVVAFRGGPATHIVLIEAKGETAWSNAQFRSKANRLRIIFSDASPDIVPHFMLASPRPPRNLRPEPWFPSWMLEADGSPRWVELRIPEARREIERWDEATGRPSKRARTWRVKRASTERR